MKSWVEDAKEIVWGSYISFEGSQYGLPDFYKIESVTCKDGTKPSGKVVAPYTLIDKPNFNFVNGFTSSALNGCSAMTELQCNFTGRLMEDDSSGGWYSIPKCDGCSNLKKIVLNSLTYANASFANANASFAINFNAIAGLSIQLEGVITLMSDTGYTLNNGSLDNMPAWLPFKNGISAYVY